MALGQVAPSGAEIERLVAVINDGYSAGSEMRHTAEA